MSTSAADARAHLRALREAAMAAHPTSPAGAGSRRGGTHALFPGTRKNIIAAGVRPSRIPDAFDSVAACQAYAAEAKARQEAYIAVHGEDPASGDLVDGLIAGGLLTEDADNPDRLYSKDEMKDLYIANCNGIRIASFCYLRRLDTAGAFSVQELLELTQEQAQALIDNIRAGAAASNTASNGNGAGPSAAAATPASTCAATHAATPSSASGLASAAGASSGRGGAAAGEATPGQPSGRQRRGGGQGHVVYSLTHRASGRVYVGQTTDLRRRLRAHLRTPPRRMRPLVAGVGLARIEDAFDVTILGRTSVAAFASKLEGRWIERLNARGPQGLNMLTGAPSLSPMYWANHRRLVAQGRLAGGRVQRPQP